MYVAVKVFVFTFVDNATWKQTSAVVEATVRDLTVTQQTIKTTHSHTHHGYTGHFMTDCGIGKLQKQERKSVPGKYRGTSLVSLKEGH